MSSLFLDPKLPLSTCSSANCQDCPLQSHLVCHFSGFPGHCLTALYPGRDRRRPYERLADHPVGGADRGLLRPGRNPGDVFALPALHRTGHQIITVLGQLWFSQAVEISPWANVGRREGGVFRRLRADRGVPISLPAGRRAVAAAGVVYGHRGRDGSRDEPPDVRPLHELRLPTQPGWKNNPPGFLRSQPRSCQGLGRGETNMKPFIFYNRSFLCPLNH
jgi:hypothetical protein